MRLLGKKEGLSKLKLNKKFDREYNQNINTDKKKLEQFLYNFIKSKLLEKASFSLTEDFLNNLTTALLDDISDNIKKLDSLTTDDVEVMKFKEEKIKELKELYEHTKEITNGTKSRRN